MTFSRLKAGASRSALFSLGFVVVLVFAGYLSLRGIGNPAFWDDEAHVAIMARNLNKLGKLTGWDGRNLYGYRNGGALDRNFRPVNAPLDILIVAASFRAFGEGEAQARVPFALIGVGALALAAVWLQVQGRDRLTTLFALSALALSPMILLYMRQGRYYSLAILASIMMLHGHTLCVRNGRTRDEASGSPGPDQEPMPESPRLAAISVAGVLLLSGGAIIAFYSNPLLAVTTTAGLGFLHLTLGGREVWTRQILLSFGAAVGITLAATVPYAVAYRIWDRPDHLPRPLFVPDKFALEIPIPGIGPLLEPLLNLRRMHQLGWNLRDINTTTLLPWMLVPLILAAVITIAVRGKKYGPQQAGGSQAMLGWGAFLLGYLAALAVFAPQGALSDNTLPDMYLPADVRYHVALFPVCAALIGGTLAWVWRTVPKAGPVLAAALLTTHLLTNALTAGFTPLRLQWWLPSFWREIHSPFPTSIGLVAEHLRAHAKQDDTLYCRPEYFSYPMLYYVGDRILLSNVVNEETHLPLEKLKAVAPHLLVNSQPPIWLVLFSIKHDRPTTAEYFQALATRLYGPGAVYRLHRHFDIYWDQIQRPETVPGYDHSFGPKRDYDRRLDSVYVLRLERQPATDAGTTGTATTAPAAPGGNLPEPAGPGST